ncbi:MAG: TetR/AcrR family transcriptional regulator [Roseobacter sp.]|jgi:AcrR family transcriptional regulator|nr:TetR/AcrR family transcriptional regulator [Roseobacter sp.]
MARTRGSSSDITAQKLHETATGLFARHGYAAVSMRRIAGAMGVQAGTLYNYTADKQSLLFDLMRGHMALLLDKFQANADLLPQERLAQMVRFHIRFHLDRTDAVFIAYNELRNLTPENRAALRAMHRQYEDRIEAIVQAGVVRGDFVVTDTRIATRAIIAMLTGMTAWYRVSGPLGLDEIEAQYVQMVRRMVGVTAE